MMDQRSTSEKRVHWRATMSEWSASGQTKAGFCRDHDIPEWQFHYWFARLREVDGAQGFARVEEEPATGVQLRLPSGLLLELSGQFDEDVLGRFLRVAGRSC